MDQRQFHRMTVIVAILGTLGGLVWMGFVVEMISTGVAEARYSAVYRDEEPFLFWFLVAFMSFFAVGTLGFGVLAAATLIKRRWSRFKRKPGRSSLLLPRRRR